MLIPERVRFIGDEDALDVWWIVNGSLLDFSSGYTFEAKLAAIGTPTTLIFTKTTGFAGAAGSGVEGDSGVPNLVVTWATTGELNSVPNAGLYLLEIKASKTADGSETTYQMKLNMRARLG